MQIATTAARENEFISVYLRGRTRTGVYPTAATPSASAVRQGEALAITFYAGEVLLRCILCVASEIVWSAIEDAEKLSPIKPGDNPAAVVVKLDNRIRRCPAFPRGEALVEG